MSATTRSQISRENTEFYNKSLLMRVVPLFLYGKFAQVKAQIPSGAGTNRVRFRRYTNLSAATTPLTEGTTPAGSQLAITTVEADCLQYGDFATLTDVISYETKDPILTETAMLQGDQAADTADQLTREVLAASTAVIYSGSGNVALGDVAAGDIITEANIKTAVLALKNNNAKKITSVVNPTDGFNTTPIPAAFVSIIHPNIAVTVKGFTGFVPVEKYPSQAGVMEGEIGTFWEVRFIETTNAKVHAAAGTGGIDVYSTMIFGMHAYGTAEIAGQALRFIVKGFESGGTEDPLEQRQTAGWKMNFIAKILNNAFMERIVSAVV